jgi:hypothetical protein
MRSKGRQPEPSFEVKSIIWDAAATVGKDNLAAIERQVDYELERRRKGDQEDLHENTPDIRTIKRIVNKDINELPPEVVLAKLPEHVWLLRNDCPLIKQLSERKTQQAANLLIIEAKHKHNDDLVVVLQDWRDRFALVPAMPFVRAFRGEFDEVWNPRSDGSYKPPLHVKCRGGSSYIIPGWSERSFVPWSWNREDFETRALYRCLREHLANAPLGQYWQSWEDTATHYKDSCLLVWSSILREVEKLSPPILAPLSPEEQSGATIENKDVADSVYEAITWQMSENSRSLPREYPFSDWREVEPDYEIFQSLYQPNRQVAPVWTGTVSFGASTLVSIRANREWNVDRIDSALKRPVAALRDDLLKKYTASKELNAIIGLENQVAELQKSLEYEFDLLLTKRILPGKCRACPDA